jgi:hypothetical protein
MKLVNNKLCRNRMASLSEAFPAPNSAASLHEKVENPQRYDQLPEFVRHVKERRHILGLVGGNEVARAAGNMADVESDLQGITRPATWSTERQHLLQTNPNKIVRENPKVNIAIDATPVPLQSYQQWAYPSVIGPVPLEKETCMKPEKF